MRIAAPTSMSQGRRRFIIHLALLFWAVPSIQGHASKIIDYQRYLNPRFSKEIRHETRFVIVHSTESSLPSALRTLSRGKVRYGHYVTRGGHAHYLIAQNGAIYRILDPKYWANHAGVSMWNGLEDLSNYSIGVELEGYHDVPFGEKQYRSLKWLLDVLKKRYEIEDRNVLEHYRIAYSAPNRFHKERLRGRKLDPGADNFNRLKAGLLDNPSEDPDIIAGRIRGRPSVMPAAGHVEASDEETEEEENLSALQSPNVISATRTAWKIAGEQYKAVMTVYSFPDGTSLRGDQIEDWSNIPAGTEVRMNVIEAKEKKLISPLRAEVLFPEVSVSLSPWKIANALYRSAFAFYLYPDGSLHAGNTISDWSAVPLRSKVLVAYRQISQPRTGNPLGEDLEDVYLAPQTIYIFPNLTIKSGDQIEDFTKIPGGTRVLAKVE
jgi:N-acetylmuramoyl-L-alanine amidase